jgi:hypothetical protein
VTQVGEPVKVGVAGGNTAEERAAERRAGAPLRVVKVVGPARIEAGQPARYRVAAYNRLAKPDEKLRVRWEIRIAGEAAPIPDRVERTQDTLCIAEVPERYAGAEWAEHTLRVYAYIDEPVEQASVETSVLRMSYIDYLRHLIDDGTTDIDDIFSSMCQRYHLHARNWLASKDIDLIFGALWNVLGTNKGNLSQADQARWNSVARTLARARKFKGEMDKLQHFIAGAGVAALGGELAGWSAAWLAEKADTLKRVWGQLSGTLQRHQIGFDWDDLQFTAAGATFADFFDDLSEDCCKSLIAVFADGQLAFSTVFTSDPSLKDGFAEFSPIISPLVQTNIDRVSDAIERMENKMRDALPAQCR